MIVLAVVLALLAAGAVVTAIGLAVTAWPEQTPRPYACAACRVDYTDARQLAWHVQGQHLDTYEARHG